MSLSEARQCAQLMSFAGSADDAKMRTTICYSRPLLLLGNGAARPRGRPLLRLDSDRPLLGLSRKVKFWRRRKVRLRRHARRRLNGQCVRSNRRRARRRPTGRLNDGRHARRPTGRLNDRRRARRRRRNIRLDGQRTIHEGRRHARGLCKLRPLAGAGPHRRLDPMRRHRRCHRRPDRGRCDSGIQEWGAIAIRHDGQRARRRRLRNDVDRPMVRLLQLLRLGRCQRDRLQHPPPLCLATTSFERHSPVGPWQR